MATVQQVLVSRLAAFQVDLTDVDLSALLVDCSLDGAVDYSSATATPVKAAIATKLAELLAMPDVTEGGMSLKWDRSAVQAYLTSLQTELGLTGSGPSVSNASFLW